MSQQNPCISWYLGFVDSSLLFDVQCNFMMGKKFDNLFKIKDHRFEYYIANHTIQINTRINNGEVSCNMVNKDSQFF